MKWFWLSAFAVQGLFAEGELAVFPTQQEMTLQPARDEPKPLIKSYKQPWLAATLSTVFPGLGHAYLGEFGTAGGLAGSSLLMMAGASDSNDIEVVLQNTWAYGIFAAYRDARLYNGNSRYLYRMPMDTLADLSTAPFRWRVLKKSEVWGGFLGYIAAAVAVGYLASTMENLKVGSGLNPMVAFPVGIGEETLFRGFIQSGISEVWNPSAGIALSSILFGAVHLVNTVNMTYEETVRYCTYSIPLITTFGAYTAWIAYRNRSLQETVALHSWIDFTIFLAGSLSESSIQKKRLNFSTAFSF